MPNKENLISLADRSEEDRKRIQSKGGKRSSEVRRKKKTMREAMELIANQKVTNKALQKSIKAITDGIDSEEIDMITAATMGIFQAAIKGSVAAYEVIGRTLEQIKSEEEMPEDELSKALRELGESL